jgi:heme oxygenase
MVLLLQLLECKQQLPAVADQVSVRHEWIKRYTMSLREITKDLHHEAETTKFAKLLLSGKITKEDYTNYLYQLLAIYNPIEFSGTRQGFFDTMPALPRFNSIYQDFVEIEEKGKHYHWLPATIEYHMYLINLANDPTSRHLIKAHLYCRHMGDLNGGQIIKKQVPFTTGKFYEFEDADELKVSIRAELTDDLGNEARVAFKFAIKIMRELFNE